MSKYTMDGVWKGFTPPLRPEGWAIAVSTCLVVLRRSVRASNLR